VPGLAGGSTQDSLSMEELALQSGFSEDFLKSHPQVQAVFDTAISEDWANGGSIGQQRFNNALHATKWWQQNSADAREYLIAKMSNSVDGKPNKEWLSQVALARTQVEAAAVQMGAHLEPQALDFFTNQYMINGWQKKPQFLQRALAGELDGFTADHIDYGKGGAQSIITQLRSVADANGVTYDDSFYNGAARSALAGLRTVDDYVSEIRGHAASRMPIFSDRIKAGENARDIASPYINRMADILEVDAKSVKLNDPWISKALGGVDTKGNPTAMSFWDFEKQLKQDPRWQYTKNANYQVDALISKLGSMFGFGG
jgi:hypothetical protein